VPELAIISRLVCVQEVMAKRTQSPGPKLAGISPKQLTECASTLCTVAAASGPSGEPKVGVTNGSPKVFEESYTALRAVA